MLPALLVAIELLLVEERPRPRSLVAGYARWPASAAIVLAVRHAGRSANSRGTFVAEALAGLGIGGRALTMLAVVPEWARLFLGRRTCAPTTRRARSWRPRDSDRMKRSGWRSSSV